MLKKYYIEFNLCAKVIIFLQRKSIIIKKVKEKNKAVALIKQRLQLFCLGKRFLGQVLKEVVVQNNTDFHQ